MTQSLNPLRDGPVWTCELKPAAMMIYNTRTGRSTGMLPIEQFPLSSKVHAELGRPHGMSRSHWRKVRRDRKPITITIDPTL